MKALEFRSYKENKTNDVRWVMDVKRRLALPFIVIAALAAVLVSIGL